MIISKKIQVNSGGNFCSINITNTVKEFVDSTGVRDGALVLYYQHTTGSVIVYEQEAGVMVDLQDAFDRLFPEDIVYQHHMRKVDANGASHVRSIFLPTSITIPIMDGKLALGKYQEIVILDMQPDPKPRSLILQVSGE